MKSLITFLFIAFFIQVHAQVCTPNTSSLLFNGSSGNATLSGDNGLDTLTTSITIEAWIRPASWGFTSAQNTIVCKHSWSSGEQGFVLRSGGQGQLSFNFAGIDPGGNPTSWKDLMSPVNSLVLNTWQHVAGTFDGSIQRIYINGIEVATQNFTGTMVPSTAFPVTIGRLSDMNVGETRYWNGHLDEVRIWSTVRSASDILDNYNSHIDTLSPGLVSYFRMNENSGSVLYDMGSGNNDANLTAGTYSTSVPFNQTAPLPYIIPSGLLLTSTPAVSYQWNLNGTPIVNATSQSYTATQNGSYTVTVTDSIGCYNTSSPYLITWVGLENLSAYGIQWKISNRNLFIESEKFLDENIVVSDISGRKITEQKMNGKFISIPLHQISAGIYLLKVGNIRTADKIFIH